MIAAGRRGISVAIVLGWALWHDLGIYNAAGPTRLGGQMYAATAYETEADCQAGQRAAMAKRGRASPRSTDRAALRWHHGLGS